MSISTPDRTPLRNVLHKLCLAIGQYLDRKSSDVQHKEVIKELYERTELSGSYVGALIFANLIALLGLLSNSVAVVIGAMLISPLMGPIFSLGLSFAMGHLTLARKAARIIGASVLLTVIVAAIFTVFSPLKEATPEILARTHPNIYDLLVAIFAGAIGAIALCTRKNYLFTTAGIAIATAVIPPLSVVGYGVGTLQLSMAMGGFLLFFTNLVAIVISSDIVFMLLRFRSSMVEENSYPLKLRVKILAVTLSVISIPLIVTLVNDVRRLNLSKRIEQTLNSHLNSEGNSRLTGFSVSREGNDVKVLASVNTVAGIDAATETRLKKDLALTTKHSVKLELEQIIVKVGAIKASEASLTKSIISLPPPPRETLATLRGKTLGMIKEACSEAGTFLAPWPVKNCGVTFSDGAGPVTIQLKVGRDFGLSDQEQRWLAIAVEKKLDYPVMLQAETAPLFADLNLDENGIPDDAGKKELTVLKDLARKNLPLRLVVYYPRGNRSMTALNLKKAHVLKKYLEKEGAVPAGLLVFKASGTTWRIKIVEEHATF
ncbi:MAG: TIGR00341 family protein [Desulfuromonadaceae bacterium]|nr:TIGR00341 family protein [Desulfuromonadaceae bacterium]